MSRLWLFVVIAILGAGVQPAAAQVPTPEQLELLKSMSPEDRQALMEQLGLGGNGDDLSGSGGQQSNTGQNPAGQGTRSTTNRPLQPPPDDKKLKPEDSVLVDIDFKKDKPARLEPQGQGLPPIQIPAEPAPVLDEVEREGLQLRINQVRARNPYQLDSSGALLLPGFEPIMLAGLNEEQATHRLRAVVPFLKLDVKVTKLPVNKTGVAGLKPFGYDLFKDASATFAPVGDVPVPSDYIIGAGDQLIVQLFGSQNRTLRLTVGQDGRVRFPELGPINVGGQTFERVASDLEGRVSRQMIGVRASVGMGSPRSIRVFVMG